jgi:hypothetical protein
MATWKKIIVSGSSADLASLALGTALPVASGGTGAQSLTDGGVLLGSGTGAVTALGQATNGQLVVGSTGADPVLATLTGGSNITVTNDAGSISIAATGLGSGTVQTVSATGTQNGLTLTSDGDTVDPVITLGGALSGVANSQLVNDSVIIGTTEVDLGATSTTLAGLTAVTVDGSLTSDKILAGSSQLISGSGLVADTKLTGSFSGSFKGDGSALTGLPDGTTPESLTSGNGISSFTFDGSAAQSVVVAADGTTLAVGTGGVKVADAGITATQLNTSVAGAGLSGGAGTALAVNVDDSSIEIATDTLRVKSSGVTNTMLVNDAITIAGNSTALGSSITAATILDGTSVISSSAQIGNYVATLGTGTGVTIGSNTGAGSSPTIAVAYGSTANTAVQGSATATFTGTTNEIEVSDASAQAIGGNIAVTIGLPDDVTVTQDLNVGRDMVISRNLTVQGTASFASTTDLDVADRFIRMASGSTATGDGGIVVQQTGPTDGEAFAYDSARTRWGVTGSYDPATNTIQPDAFMSTVVEGAVGADTPAAVVAKYAQKGNIFVGANQDIYIYS